MPGSWGIFSSRNYAGTDQGVDFRGAGFIPALDSATVTDVGRASIVEGGTYPYVVYRLNSGPYRGHYVYTAENFTPLVHKGQRLRQGQAIGRAKGAYPYIETGFNKTPTGWNAVAPLGGVTYAGVAMKAYLYGLVGQAPPVTVPDTSATNPATGGGKSSSLPPGTGGVLSHVPGVSQVEAVGSFFGKLLDPTFWLRTVEVVGGFLILLLGLYLLARQVGLAGVPQPPTPGLSEETLASLKEPPGIDTYKPAYRRSTEGVKRDRVKHELSESAQRRAEVKRRAELAQPDDDVPF